MVHEYRKGNYTKGHGRHRVRMPPREHLGAQLWPVPTKRESEQIGMEALLEALAKATRFLGSFKLL